jgi:cell division protein FtsQ
MRNIHGGGNQDGVDDVIFADEPLSPRRAIDNARADSSFNAMAPIKPRSARAQREDGAKDILLDAPAPRSRRSAGAIPKREKGYAQVSPNGSRNHGGAREVGRGLVWPSKANRKVILTLLLGFCILALYWVSEPLGRWLERPIKSVVVEGEFHFISKGRATELLEREIDGDFLQLDLMRLKKALMDDPWVESVTLNRRWPDTLVVKIAEQKPIARWGDGFLNQRGEIVRVEKLERLNGLPWLQGSESDTIEILQQYQDLSQLLRARGLEVEALKCDNKKTWRLTIKNAVEIAIGRDQVMEKMRRFVTVYDNYLSSVWGDVKAVDVRYSNGVAVRWVSDSAMANKYLKNRLIIKE